jgi:transposase
VGTVAWSCCLDDEDHRGDPAVSPPTHDHPARVITEFWRDVIAVGEASISQVARDFGISESCLQRWLKIADRDDGLAPTTSADRGGGSKDESVELREFRRRNKLLEQGERDRAPRDGLFRPRRPPKMTIYPLVRELAAAKILVAVTCRVLGFSEQAFCKWQANPVRCRLPVSAGAGPGLGRSWAGASGQAGMHDIIRPEGPGEPAHPSGPCPRARQCPAA